MNLRSTPIQVIEGRNINNRCQTLETLINATVHDVNNRLFGDSDKDDHQLTFKYGPISTDEMKEYISYIHKWKGLTSTAKIPTTYKEYETKARNWLNGRRAKKYSNNLFVDMIQSVFDV